MANEVRAPIVVLRNSHERLTALVDPMDHAALVGPSYDPGWNIAQVLSHLGSQSEIFAGIFDAVLAGQDPPGPDSFPPVWEAWNAKTPDDQARDWRRVEADLIQQLESLDDDQLAISVQLFGMTLDVTALARMRLSEHALHSWDVAVVGDDGASLPADATEILVDQIPMLAGRTGRAEGHDLRVEVRTTTPERRFVLAVSDGVELKSGEDATATGRLELPAEALVRLVAGRLDAAHTPADVKADGVSLDELRSIFPGL